MILLSSLRSFLGTRPCLTTVCRESLSHRPAVLLSAWLAVSSPTDLPASVSEPVHLPVPLLGQLSQISTQPLRLCSGLSSPSSFEGPCPLLKEDPTINPCFSHYQAASLRHNPALFYPSWPLLPYEVIYMYSLPESLPRRVDGDVKVEPSA